METLVSAHKTTCCNNPKDHSLRTAMKTSKYIRDNKSFINVSKFKILGIIKL
jgi:hypothetical protein